MSYLYVGVLGFIAGAILERIYLAKALSEAKNLLTEAHAKLDTLISAAKAKL
jgi:hypothetical protein